MTFMGAIIAVTGAMQQRERERKAEADRQKTERDWIRMQRIAELNALITLFGPLYVRNAAQAVLDRDKPPVRYKTFAEEVVP